MHLALKPAADKLHDTELFKRFIDDISWLSFGDQLTKLIEIAISDALDQVGLKITVPKFCVSDSFQNLEFLDVLRKASRVSPMAYSRYGLTCYISCQNPKRPTSLAGKSASDQCGVCLLRKDLVQFTRV